MDTSQDLLVKQLVCLFPLNITSIKPQSDRQDAPVTRSPSSVLEREAASVDVERTDSLCVPAALVTFRANVRSDRIELELQECFRGALGSARVMKHVAFVLNSKIKFISTPHDQFVSLKLLYRDTTVTFTPEVHSVRTKVKEDPLLSFSSGPVPVHTDS